MKVLVTGATGLLGGHLLRTFDSAFDVHAVARRAPSGELEPLAQWIEADLSLPLDRTRLPGSVDSVVHLAQSDRFRELPESAEHVFAVNVAATFALLEYARRAGASSFVFASTGGVYARSSEPLSEDDPLDLRDLYFRSKHVSEQLIDGFSDHFRTVSLRPFFVYGPGRSELLIPKLAASVRAGETVRIEGERGMEINPLFAGEAAAAVVGAIAGEARGVVNIAGPENVTITSLVQLLGELTGMGARVEHAGEDPGSLIADTGRMRAELGVDPSVGLREGLTALLGA